MIQLPPGFDGAALANDLWLLGMPLVTIVLAYTGYRILKSIIGKA